MQKFKFPMKNLRVTQGELSTFSHAGSLAIDFGGKDTGSDKLYAPCDMVVKRCRHNATGELYLESIEPVRFADGTADYARLLCVHDSSFNVSEGQIIKQGEYFYDEGGMGSGNPNKFAIHVHIEGGKGKWTSCTQFRNTQGTYVCEKQSHLYDMFILDNDTVIEVDKKTGAPLDGGYAWVREGKEEEMSDVIYGVDLSSNRSIDAMNKIVDNGKAEFVVHRVAVGSESVDKHFDQYLKDTGDLKVGFFAANYFYNNKEAEAEANFLIDTIEKYGFNPENTDLPIFCDWEGFSYEWNASEGRIITPEQLREMTEAWADVVQKRGYVAGIYTNKNYWDNWYGQAFFDAHPEYKIWFARPIEASKPDRECYMWQYACNDGAEYGLAGEPLDKNILYGEYVSEIVKPFSSEPVRMYIGYASGGDIKILKEKVEKLGIKAEADNGYIITGYASRGDQVTIRTACKELKVKCVEYKEPVIEEVPAPPVEEPEVKPTPCSECELKDAEIKVLKAASEARAREVDELSDENATLKVELATKIAAYEVLQGEYHKQLDNVVKLSGETDKLKTEKFRLETQLADAIAKHEQCETSISNLERAREELIVERDALVSEVEFLKAGAVQGSSGIIALLEKFIKWLKGE